MSKACLQNRPRLLSAILGVAFIVALAAPQRVSAQVLYGSIVGEVRDASGAAVPGATVTIMNKDTNQSREAKTDSAGSYNFIDVQTSTYTVKVTQQGFKTFERAGVRVALNSVMRVDVALEVGAVSQTVEVTGAPPPLQTETAEVHADVQAAELENLPVPLGRNYQQVYRALPGFSPPSNSHSIPTNPSRSLEFNVNGTSDDQNNTRIDGVSTYNIQLPHVNSYVPTLESIQEVNIVTDSFDAEQGLAGGAAINVQTKSGTNQIHGSLFEFNSNNHTKAWPDRIDEPSLNVGNKPKFIYNQFGGTVGGPIKKDKLFFFVSYEGTRDHRAVDRRITVAPGAFRLGDLSALLNGTGTCSSFDPTSDGVCVFDPQSGDPTTGLGRTPFSVGTTDPNYALCDISTNPNCWNIIPASRLDPVAQKIIGLVPLPSVAGREFKSRNYFASGPFAFNRNQVDTKINFNATPKLNFIGTFGMLHYSDTVPTVFGTAAVGRPIGGSSNPGRGHGNTFRTTIMGTYTFSPNFLMDAHFGWARQGTSSEQPGLGTNTGSDVLGIPGTNGTRNFESGWPEFDFSGSDDYATIGVDNNFMPYYRQDPQYQYVANFNWVKSKHNLRFGTDLYRQGLNHTQAEFLSGAYGAQGGFNFTRGTTERCEILAAGGSCDTVSDNARGNSFASFILGLPSLASRTYQVPDVYRIHAWLYSAYARDRWNVTPKLTLDYGLRWEYYPVPARPDRGIERYDLDTNKVLVCGVGSVPKDCGIQISKRLFEPRIGLAYRVRNTFVIRTGYGITIDPYEFMEALRANYPVLLALNLQTPNDLFPSRRLDNSTPSYPALPAGVDPITAPSLGNGIIDIPSDFGFEGLPKNFRRGYIQSWNFTIQKELRYGFTGQVGYVATRSIRQLGFLDLNAGQVLGAGEAGRPLKAKFGRDATTVFLLPVGTGHYDSLQASLQRRFAQGLALTVNYTWGKAINSIDNSSNSPGDEKIQALQYMYLNRSVTDFDRTHNLEIMNVWQLPFGSGKRWLNNRGVVSKIVSGWQVNSLASFITGPPFTVYASGNLDMPGSNQTADQVKPQVTKLGGIGADHPFYDPTAFADVTQRRFGTTGFNAFRGPGIGNWDFGLFREFSISERLKLQFRAESFNFTNTPHFDIPDHNVSDGSDFMTVTDKISLAREGLDERQFRFGLRLTF